MTIEHAIPIDTWRRLNKDGWDKLIRRWNYRQGTVKKLPRVVTTAGLHYLPPRDAETARKEEKRRRRQNVFQAPQIAWEDVPQKLPYRRGEDDTILVDAEFWEMAKQLSRRGSQKYYSKAD